MISLLALSDKPATSASPVAILTLAPLSELTEPLPASFPTRPTVVPLESLVVPTTSTLSLLAPCTTVFSASLVAPEATPGVFWFSVLPLFETVLFELDELSLPIVPSDSLWLGLPAAPATTGIATIAAAIAIATKTFFMVITPSSLFGVKCISISSVFPHWILYGNYSVSR